MIDVRLCEEMEWGMKEQWHSPKPPVSANLCGALGVFVEAGHPVFVQGPCGIETGQGRLILVNGWV